MELWETVHRWEWFRRSQWLGNFRDSKLRLRDGVTALAKQHGLADGLLLDCSCGLGFQAITLHEAGLRVQGSDRSPFAVSRARELSRTQGHEIEFFVSLWQELPERTSQRFDAVFCDALSWIHTPLELAAALRGIRGILRPGGLLMFQGVPRGATEETSRQELDEWWNSNPRAWLSWRHTEDSVTCTSMSVGSLGDDYIDWHLLYLIDERDTPRLEHLTIRESMRWRWDSLSEIVHGSGFSGLSTYTSEEWSPGGRPTALNFATATDVAARRSS
jgi:SAM-dependent methyltransferase